MIFDWFRPLLYALVRLAAWALILVFLGGIGAYLAMLYFKYKGF